MAALNQTTIPWCTVIVRNSFGVAGAAHQPAGRLALCYAWLSGYWGSLPLEGGIEAAYRADIDAAPDPKANLAEIEERLTDFFLEEACSRYTLTVEEFLSWQYSIDQHGLATCARRAFSSTVSKACLPPVVGDEKDAATGQTDRELAKERTAASAAPAQQPSKVRNFSAPVVVSRPWRN
jgi:Protein of unknown function (DUF1153)